MTKVLTTILILATLTTFGQFPEGHLDLLAKINCGLTDPWTSEVSQTESFNGTLNIPSIKVDLYTYKTVDDKGGNIGIGIYMFDTTYADTVRNYHWGEGLKNSGYKYFETNSYIIVAAYFQSANKLYNRMLPVLLRELGQYFDENKEKL